MPTQHGKHTSSRQSAGDGLVEHLQEPTRVKGFKRASNWFVELTYCWKINKILQGLAFRVLGTHKRTEPRRQRLCKYGGFELPQPGFM